MINIQIDFYNKASDVWKTGRQAYLFNMLL